jgi:hypothetical protein
MGGQAGGGDDQSGQGGRVLGEHRPQGGIGAGQDVLDEVTLRRLRCRFGLPDGLQERDALENEGDAQHGVADDEVAGRLWSDQLLDAVRDRHCSAGHEQPDRGEQ